MPTGPSFPSEGVLFFDDPRACVKKFDVGMRLGSQCVLILPTTYTLWCLAKQVHFNKDSIGRKLYLCIDLPPLSEIP